MEEPKRTLTRKELHDLVWSVPIQQLAAQYGISDRGLAKTCERHLVPVPGRGHWAKVAAGLPSNKSPLRPVQNTDLHTVHIGRRPETRQNEYLLELLATAKAEVENEDRLIPDNQGVTAPKTRAKPQFGAPSIDLTSSIRPNATVRSFLAGLHAAGPDRDGFVPHRSIRVSPSDLDRIGTFLAMLSRALAEHDFQLNVGFSEGQYSTARMNYTKEGTEVSFHIEAPRKKIVEVSKYGYRSYSHKHVGRLVFEISGSAEGTTKKWSDTETRGIESCIPKIVESFRLNLVANRERDKRAQEQAAHRERMARRREMSALRIKREKDRLAFLNEIAAMRQECRALQETIQLISEIGQTSSEYSKMIGWAELRLASLQEQISLESIEGQLIERKLYPEPDDLFDPEGEPPPKLHYWDD